jgi:hypothetical protein
MHGGTQREDAGGVDFRGSYRLPNTISVKVRVLLPSGDRFAKQGGAIPGNP